MWSGVTGGVIFYVHMFDQLLFLSCSNSSVLLNKITANEAALIYSALVTQLARTQLLYCIYICIYVSILQLSWEQFSL